MVRQSVQSGRNAYHAGRSDDDESDEEQNTGYLLHNSSANKLAHIGNAVAARMIGFELTLNEGAPGVQELPAKHIDGTRKGSQGEHSGWNGKDTGSEDDCAVGLV